MGTERAADAGLTAAQAMDFWLWLWLGFAERETALSRRIDLPGTAEVATGLSAELKALESVSSRLSLELPPLEAEPPAGRTWSRLQAGLAADSVRRLAAWLGEPSPPPVDRIHGRAAEVLRQVQTSPLHSRPRAAAIELWTWLTGAEADRRRKLAGADGDRPSARQLSDELRLLQTVQAGLRRGQPDIIPSHPHEATWLGARQPFVPIAAAELAAVLRRAQAGVVAGRGGAQLGQLVAATAARLEALAGPEALAAALEREPSEASGSAVRRKIAAGLADAAERAPRHGPERFLGRPVRGDATRLGATLVDADLGDQVAWRAVISPRGFDEAAEFGAAGAARYELYLLVAADGALSAIHQRIERSPHGRRWFRPVATPGWLHRPGETLDVAWPDVAAAARSRMLALLASLTSDAGGRSALAAPLPDEVLALAVRRARRSRH